MLKICLAKSLDGNRRIHRCLLLAVLLFSGLAACDHNKKKDAKSLVKPGETAAQVFQKAEKKMKSRLYEDAIDYFDAVKNHFPYDPLATESEFKKADTYFEWKKYGDAAAAYASFQKIHPGHEKVAEALFREARSLAKESPKTIDRDLSSCRESVERFDGFFRRFPLSPLVDEARQWTLECRRKLAGQEFYVGRFYYRRGEYASATRRLEGVLRDHAGFGYDEQAAWYLGRSYRKMKVFDEARRVFANLVERFPETHYGKKAAKEIRDLP